jgi:hypothetical protein
MGEDGKHLALLESEVKHIREKVDEIDTELKALKLGARIAVIDGTRRNHHLAFHALIFHGFF